MLRDLLRGWPWLFLSVLTLACTLVLAPAQAVVLIWSLSKLALAAYLGYWIDRTLFPYARPDQPQEGFSRNWSMLRRAILVAAVVIGLGLGV
jgi:hypothetical protein